MSVNNTYLLNPARQVVSEPFKTLFGQNEPRTFSKPCGFCQDSQQSSHVNSQYVSSPLFSELNNSISPVRLYNSSCRTKDNGRSYETLSCSLSDRMKVSYKTCEIDGGNYKGRLLNCTGEVRKGFSLPLNVGFRRVNLPASSSSLRKEIGVDWTGKHGFCLALFHVKSDGNQSSDSPVRGGGGGGGGGLNVVQSSNSPVRGGGGRGGLNVVQSSNSPVRGGGGLNVVAKVGQSESSLQEAAVDDEEEQLNMRIRALMGSLEASVGTSSSETDDEEGEDDAPGKNTRRRSWQERGEWDEGWGWGETQRERRKGGRKKGSSGRLNTLVGETGSSDKAVYGTQTDMDILGGSSVWRGNGTPGESWQDVSMGMELIWRKLPVVEGREDKVGKSLYKQRADSEKLTGQKGDREEERTGEVLGTGVNQVSESQLLNTSIKGETVGEEVRQGSTGVTLDSVNANVGLGGIDSVSWNRNSVISDPKSEYESVSTGSEGEEMGGIILGKDREIDSKTGEESRLRIEESLLSSEPPDQVGINGNTQKSDLGNDVSSVGEVGSENSNVEKELKELVLDDGIVGIEKRQLFQEAKSSGIAVPLANGRKSEGRVTPVFNGTLSSESSSKNVTPGEGVSQLGISSSGANQPSSTFSSLGRPAGASSAGVPILAGDQSYQRLTINNDLALYSARTLARGGRVKEAEAKLRQCIRVWPGDGRAYVTLGKVMQNQGRMKEARKVYEEGCQAVGGDNAFLWQAWAVLEERLGNKTRARTLFDAATAADKRHVAGWHGWAMLELREGNEMKARKLLKKGLQLCGASEYFYQTLAILEAKAGRLAEARVLFRKATAANQWSVPSWLAWAKMEVKQGEVEVARKLFQRALESSPKNRYTYQAWALFEAEQGKDAVARKLLQMGRRLNPKDTGLCLAGALIEYESGFTGAARDLFREGTLLDPKFGSMWRAWGWMEWREGQLDAARELYERAAVVEPDSPRVYQAMGVLEEGAGNTALARKLFKRALKSDPSNVATWYSWAAMEERLGNSVRAEELRTLCQQQSTEVVDNSWEFSDLLGPAIDRVRSFFNFEREPRSSGVGKEEISTEVFVEEEEEDSVDIEKFLVEKIEPKLKPTKVVHSIWKRRVPPEEVQRVREKSKRYNRFLRQREDNQGRIGESDEEKE